MLYLGFYVPRQKEGENCPFCPLKIMLDLPGYCKIKLNLLYCVLEMHFKDTFLKKIPVIWEYRREGSTISREYDFQTAKKRFFCVNV